MSKSKKSPVSRATSFVRTKSAKTVEEVEKLSSKTSGDSVSVDATIVSRVVTHKDLLKKLGLDPDVWREVEWSATAGTTWVKDSENTPTERDVWYVKARFKRIAPESAVVAMERLASRLPKLQLKTKANREKNSESFLVIGMADIHFGKRCVGSDSSLKHTEQMFGLMVDRILSKTPEKLEHIYLLNLGDLLQVDTPANTTTRGTPVDTSADSAAIYEAGMISVFRAIERCRERAPVSFITVPGNHDWSSCLHIALSAKHAFAKVDGVTVDASPAPRKYIHRGANLIGMSHGNNEKPGNLAGIMIAEKPFEFARSESSRVFLKGHLHSMHAARHIETAETSGCVVYTLPSPAAIDSYHDTNGFVGNKRACQGFVFHDRFGLETIHEVSVKSLL